MIGPLDSVMRWWKHADETAPKHVADTEPPPPKKIIAPQRPWLARYDEENRPHSLIYPKTTLGRLVDQAAERYPDHLAILYNGRRWNYAELRSAVNRMAGGLAHMGVRRGDTVMLTLPNCPEFVIAFFAIQKLGAVVVNAGPLMGVDDLKTILSLTQPRVAIGLDLLSDKLAEAGVNTSVMHWIWASLRTYQPVIKRVGYHVKLWQRMTQNHGAAHHPWQDVLDNAPSRPPTVEPDFEAVALLQPTGGTTSGSIKVAQLSHRNLLSNVVQYAIWAGVRTGQERICVVLPMFHIYSMTLCLINGVYYAASMALVTRFDAHMLLDLARHFRPTVTPIVPTMCIALCDEIEKKDRSGPLPSLGRCLSGAAPLSADLAERFEKLTGSQIIEGYGLTEAAPVTHANFPGKNRPGSVGVPMPDTNCRIADLHDPSIDVPQGQPGELLVSGPQIMRGYLANPDATAAALYTDDHDRTWLRTGDIATMGADGYFAIVDRKKDMIIRSGLKVFPNKVEAVLAKHPNAKEVAVIGRPDPVHTSTVVAIIVPKEKIEHPEKMFEEMKHSCREHLAPYEVPSTFELADALPRSVIGKLLKRTLRENAPETPSLMETPPALPDEMHDEHELPAAIEARLNLQFPDDNNPHTPPTNGKHPSKGKEAA